jgi:hypothetical protein
VRGAGGGGVWRCCAFSEQVAVCHAIRDRLMPFIDTVFQTNVRNTGQCRKQ